MIKRRLLIPAALLFSLCAQSAIACVARREATPSTETARKLLCAPMPIPTERSVFGGPLFTGGEAPAGLRLLRTLNDIANTETADPQDHGAELMEAFRDYPKLRDSVRALVIRSVFDESEIAAWCAWVEGRSTSLTPGRLEQIHEAVSCGFEQ